MFSTHLYPAPRLRMGGALPLLSLYVSVVGTGTALPLLSFLLINMLWVYHSAAENTNDQKRSYLVFCVTVCMTQDATLNSQENGGTILYQKSGHAAHELSTCTIIVFQFWIRIDGSCQQIHISTALSAVVNTIVRFSRFSKGRAWAGPWNRPRSTGDFVCNAHSDCNAMYSYAWTFPVPYQCEDEK